MEIVFRFVCVCIAFLSPQKVVGWGGSQGPLRATLQRLLIQIGIYIYPLVRPYPDLALHTNTQL